MNKIYNIIIGLLVVIVILLSVPLFLNRHMVDDKELPPQITRLVDGNNVCYVYKLNNGGGLKAFDEVGNDQIAISCVKK